MSFFFPSKKFNEPLNTAVFTTVHVMKEQSPIVWVSHELDGDWQFMGNEPIEDYIKIAMVVCLEEIIKVDKSVLKVADLPMGYCATRETRSDKWLVAKIDYSEEEIREFGYYCSKCGVYHKEIPMCYGSDAPYSYYLIPEDERQIRCTLSGDQCIIDSKFYFIRGGIELSIEKSSDNFRWDIWVSVSEEVFKRMTEIWEDENRVLEKPYIGKIASQLEPYPTTLDLPVMIINQKVGCAPKIEILECNHPLYLEQENGINMERVISFAKEILYTH